MSVRIALSGENTPKRIAARFLIAASNNWFGDKGGICYELGLKGYDNLEYGLLNNAQREKVKAALGQLTNKLIQRCQKIVESA